VTDPIECLSHGQEDTPAVLLLPCSRDEEILSMIRKHCCTVEWEDQKPNWWEGIMPWESNIGRSLLIRIFSNIFEKRGRRLIAQ
jgi:hypothetical protein